MNRFAHRKVRSRKLNLDSLESRLTPTVTASFVGGFLIITSDNATDDLRLFVQGTGAFALTDSNATVSLPNSPTIANVDGISIQLGGGDDRLNLSEIPAGNWTVVVDGGTGADSILGSAGSDVLNG